MWGTLGAQDALVSLVVMNMALWKTPEVTGGMKLPRGIAAVDAILILLVDFHHRITTKVILHPSVKHFFCLLSVHFILRVTLRNGLIHLVNSVVFCKAFHLYKYYSNKHTACCCFPRSGYP